MKTKSNSGHNVEDDLSVHYHVLSLEYLCFLKTTRLSLRIDCKFATKSSVPSNVQKWKGK